MNPRDPSSGVETAADRPYWTLGDAGVAKHHRKSPWGWAGLGDRSMPNTSTRLEEIAEAFADDARSQTVL